MHKRNRILVVEDSATQRQALESLLESLDYDVTCAVDGEDALETVKRAEFDLVVSDVVMPGMSGFDLCMHIKRDPDLTSRPPVLLLTSMADPRDIVRGLEAGADNYVTKPYQPQQLAARIEQALSYRGTTVESIVGKEVEVDFLGDKFVIHSDPHRILRLLLSSFEDIIRVNQELTESQRQLAAAHQRELEHEQRAREEAEATTVRHELLRSRAEAATRARDDVLAAVSHDLRNPVSTVFTAASLLIDMEELPAATRKRQLDIIRRTALRMDRLIQDLLDVARLENGALVVNKGLESLNSLMQEVQDGFASVAEAEHVELRFEKPNQDWLFPIDRGRVLQVFSNLIGNALKFTPADGTVVVSSVVKDGNIEFCVADTGAGIPLDALPHIFDRFWQGKEKKSAGAGLGLAISKGIVEGHGGTIWAESTEGAGSRFYFTLPMKRDTAKA
ncbi:MAG: hybrid sensor histidine kinase/response regulator [Longimicrobiales bacterium]